MPNKGGARPSRRKKFSNEFLAEELFTAFLGKLVSYGAKTLTTPIHTYDKQKMRDVFLITAPIQHFFSTSF